MPGENVNLTNAAVPLSRPADTGKLFVPGPLERGSTSEPIIVHGMPEFKAKAGGKISQSYLYDGAEAFFQEGGETLILGRQVGTTPVAASVELENVGAAKVLKVAAKSVGEWGNALTVQVKAGGVEGSYRLVIAENGVAVEESTDLLTQAAGATWSTEHSTHVTVTVLGGSGNPKVVAATALTGGTADLAHLTTATAEAAVALWPYDLGCGQVSSGGNTSSATQTAILAHCEINNRTPLPDLQDTTTSGTLVSAVSSLHTVTGARRGAPYAPWAIIPGSAPGTTRKVPYSFIQAGIFARNDATSSPPNVNEPSAGENGKPRYAIGLTAEWNRATRETLNEAGINVARIMPDGSIETYGNRTLVNPETEPAWGTISAARLFMYVISQGEIILRRFTFKTIDPHGLLFGRIAGELKAFLGSLGNQISNNANEAVNTGPSVNTPETLVRKELCAAIEVLPSPDAETATLNITARAE